MGLVYTEAGEGHMHSDWQKKVPGRTEDGQDVNITIQVTVVNKALVSIGQHC